MDRYFLVADRRCLRVRSRWYISVFPQPGRRLVPLPLFNVAYKRDAPFVMFLRAALVERGHGSRDLEEEIIALV